MLIHNLIQGSDEWCQFRLNHNGASEAAAMLGISTKVKRTELLHMKHTGLAKEFTDWVQENILDHGHEVEAKARPIVESIIGDDLYPVTCSDGDESASCDGLVITETRGWEHKQWNASLAAAVAAKELPDEFMAQPQQCLMVTGAESWTFTVSDGTEANIVSMEILPDPAWFDRIRAGWAQFGRDLAEYVPKELIEKPQAEAIMQLPALVVQIKGEVSLSNLPAFKAAADKFIANIRTDLQTDQDFADAENTVKFCKDAEDNLELTKNSAIAQTASIDELMRTIDHIKDQLRTKRLALEKLVTSKKTSIKEEILATVKLKFVEHVAALDAEIKPIRLVYAQPDFAGAMKNKRTLASLHDAVDTLLASAKITTNTTAADIRAKLAWCKTNAEGYGFLFMDMQQIVGKAEEDFQLTVRTRIADHKKTEAEKLEAQRKKIQAEEEAKALEKIKEVPQEAADKLATEVLAAPANCAEVIVTATTEPLTDMQSGRAPQAYSFPRRPTPTTEVPTLTLGKIGTRLGFSLTAEFLRTIGFEPAGRERSAVLFHENDWQEICAALIAHVSQASELQQQAA